MWMGIGPRLSLPDINLTPKCPCLWGRTPANICPCFRQILQNFSPFLLIFWSNTQGHPQGWGGGCHLYFWWETPGGWLPPYPAAAPPVCGVLPGSCYGQPASLVPPCTWAAAACHPIPVRPTAPAEGGGPIYLGGGLGGITWHDAT